MRGLILFLGFFALNANSAQVMSTISTFKNGQLIGVRLLEGAELRNAAIALSDAFKENAPSYENLVNVAKAMTAKDRCFNLYSSKFALASIRAGRIDASQYAEVFLKDSISSIEAVNSLTEVKCEVTGDEKDETAPRTFAQKSRVGSSQREPENAIQIGRKQDCFLISGTLSIVPTWRDNNVPISRAHANVDKVVAQTGATETEKQKWHQLVIGIYSSRITSF